MVGLSGGGVTGSGEGLQIADFSLYRACKALPIGTA